MKKFRQLVRETNVEPDMPSMAAMTYKQKPNKEPMQKMKEETDTTEKVEMTQSQLHFISYACKEILEYIEKGGEVEEWYQVKVAKSFSEFESLHSFIEGEKRRTGMVKEEEIDESLLGTAAGGVGQFIGNKIDHMHGEILRHHGYAAGEMAENHIRAGLSKIHNALKKHLSTGNAQHYSESVEITEEEYDSVPASKSLQKAHDDERKRRGLPDPDYYLKLRDQKKKEIEDMKKEEVDLEEGYYKNQEIERQETERLKPPFTPDKPKKQAIAGKQGAGYSTARHLARQAMKKYTKPVKESLEESRRSEIIKEIVKKKKNDSETYQEKPVLSSEIVKEDK
jgi:hypothetical protein